MSVWQETDPLPPDMPLIQLGQLDWEMGKNYPAEIAIRADLKATLDALIPDPRRNRRRAAASRGGNKNCVRRRPKLVREMRPTPRRSQSTLGRVARGWGLADDAGRRCAAGRCGARQRRADQRCWSARHAAVSRRGRLPRVCQRRHRLGDRRGRSASSWRGRSVLSSRSSATAAPCTPSRRFGPPPT